MSETQAPDSIAEDTRAPSPPRYVTRKFEITANPYVMERIDRFFALLHWNSRYGHSATFGMSLDGDGCEKVTVHPEPEHQIEVGLIGGVGADVECASDNGFYGIFKHRERKHWSAKGGELRVDGKLHTVRLDTIFPYSVTSRAELAVIIAKLKELESEMV